MKKPLKNSAILLLFLGLLFAIPIVTVGLSVHGPELALLAGISVVILIFIGPLSFLLASSIATDFELVIIGITGTAIFFSWLRALLRKQDYWVPYMPVTGWALMGAYFCISLFFEHAASP